MANRTSPPPPCELCALPANLFCASDDACLCWQCDAQVHGANFLVARHIRNYICCCCASLTLCIRSGSCVPSENHFCRECPHRCSTTQCRQSLNDSEDEGSSITNINASHDSRSSNKHRKFGLTSQTKKKRPFLRRRKTLQQAFHRSVQVKWSSAETGRVCDEESCVEEEVSSAVPLEHDKIAFKYHTGLVCADPFGQGESTTSSSVDSDEPAENNRLSK